MNAFPATAPWRACLLALLLGLAACAETVKHTPVPEKEMKEAALRGYPADIRFWSDELPENIERVVSDCLAQYKKTNQDYFDKHGKLPPLHYLAISGGAYDGAFGAGFLTGWADSGREPPFALVTGVSTGALTAPFVFLGKKYDPKLKELFTSTSSETIYETGIWKVLGGLTGGLAVTDSTPLAKKIKDNVTPEVMREIAGEHAKCRRLFIGTTNMEAQRGVIWDIGAIASSGHPGALGLIHDIMLASAAIPGAFKPIFIEVEAGGKKYSEIHVDGGLVSQVFIYPLQQHRRVVEAFKSLGIERHLFVIRNSKVTPEYKALDPGLFGISLRSLETLTKYQGLGDLYRLYVGTQRDGIEYNLVTIPPSFTNQPQQLFDPEYMTALFEVGYKMGQEPNVWLKAPPGTEYLKEEPASAKPDKDVKREREKNAAGAGGK